MNSGIIEVGWPVVVIGFMKISAWCVFVGGGVQDCQHITSVCFRDSLEVQ